MRFGIEVIKLWNCFELVVFYLRRNFIKIESRFFGIFTCFFNVFFFLSFYGSDNCFALRRKETPINFLIYHDIQHNYTIYTKIEERTSTRNVSCEFSSSFFSGDFAFFCCFAAGDFRAVGGMCLRQGRETLQSNFVY